MPDTDETPENAGRRGPPRKKLGHRERSKYLRLLRQGYGATLAREKMGLGRRVVRNTEEDCPGFRRRVRDARVAARQSLELVAYRLARQGDEKILPRMLARIDKARQLALAARQHRERMALLDDDLGARVQATSVINAVVLFNQLSPFVPAESLPTLTEVLRSHLLGLKAPPPDPARGPDHDAG